MFRFKPAQGLGVAINWGDMLHGMAAPVKRIPQSQRNKNGRASLMPDRFPESLLMMVITL